MSIYIKTWITCLEVQEHFEGISVWGPEEPLFEEPNAYAEPAIDDARAHAIVLAGSPKDVRTLINSGYDLNKPYLCNTLLSTAVKSVTREPSITEPPVDALKKLSYS